jgi:Fur family transcriptional regulator, ferric uptake regulator
MAMSVRGPTIGVVETNIQEERGRLKSTLHERGMRMTPQRQLVLDALLELEHATPEQVCQHVQRSTPTVNITTVYRTLELLESLGVVRHTHLGHGAPNYSVHEHKHVHLVCHRCERVFEVPCEVMDDLRGTLAVRFGFALDASHLALSGLCANCQKEIP